MQYQACLLVSSSLAFSFQRHKIGAFFGLGIGMFLICIFSNLNQPYRNFVITNTSKIVTNNTSAGCLKYEVEVFNRNLRWGIE